MTKRTEIIAHRGYSGKFPENSLEAFRQAILVKSDGIELDVHLNPSNQLIVAHDYDENAILLTEVLELLTALNFTGILLIEIKGKQENIEEILSNLMKAQTWKFRYIYSSFSFKSLKILKKLQPEIENSALFRPNPIQMIRARRFDNYQPRKNLSFLSNLTKKSVRIWTINGEKEMKKAFRSKVSAIITDFPEQAIKIRETIEKAH